MLDISICCTCYNHEEYIAQALDSMLAQKGDFTFEILIHDDASTDASKYIIKKYQEKYPSIVKPIFQEKNQYSLGIPINETYNFPRASGEYIALCEGDDYWVDEYKLLKQLLYMRANSECTFCFTNANIYDMSNNQKKRVFVPYYKEEKKYINKSGEYYLPDILNLSFIPTASFMFRASDYDILKDVLQKPFPYGDLRYKLLFTSLGYAYFLDEITCVYRENVKGSAMNIWSMQDRKENFDRLYSVYMFLKWLDKTLDYRYTEDIEKEANKYIDYCIEYLYSTENFKLDGIKQGVDRAGFVRKMKIMTKLLMSKNYEKK